jgi:cyclopropane fatty-acyl-phospholipid synthase-like methyltransferase
VCPVTGTSVPERLRWAVAALAVAPGDRLLEIGCGNGAALSMVCDRLRTGTITALDRSAAMVRLARQRNAAHIRSGRATVHVGELTTVDLDPMRFDKVFAINVNLFWTRSPVAELERIKGLLTPDGALHLCYEPPTPSRLPELADRLSANLSPAFRHTTRTVTTPTPLLGVVAYPA